MRASPHLLQRNETKRNGEKGLLEHFHLQGYAPLWVLICTPGTVSSFELETRLRGPNAKLHKSCI